MDGSEEVDTPVARVMRVMTWNVLMSGWPRIEAIEAVIRDARPDVVGLQEIGPRALFRLADRLGMARALCATGGGRGPAVGLLSRWPVREGPSHVDAPLCNALLEAVIEPPDATPLRIFVTHLAAG